MARPQRRVVRTHSEGLTECALVLVIRVESEQPSRIATQPRLTTECATQRWRHNSTSMKCTAKPPTYPSRSRPGVAPRIRKFPQSDVERLLQFRTSQAPESDPIVPGPARTLAPDASTNSATSHWVDCGLSMNPARIRMTCTVQVLSAARVYVCPVITKACLPVAWAWPKLQGLWPAEASASVTNLAYLAMRPLGRS